MAWSQLSTFVWQRPLFLFSVKFLQCVRCSLPTCPTMYMLVRAFRHLLGPYCNSTTQLLTTLTHSLPSSLPSLSPVATFHSAAASDYLSTHRSAHQEITKHHTIQAQSFQHLFPFLYQHFTLACRGCCQHHGSQQ